MTAPLITTRPETMRAIHEMRVDLGGLLAAAPANAVDGISREDMAALAGGETVAAIAKRRGASPAATEDRLRRAELAIRQAIWDARFAPSPAPPHRFSAAAAPANSSTLIRAWMRRRLADADDVAFDALMAELVAHLIADADYLAALVAETVAPIARAVALETVAASATHVSFADAVVRKGAPLRARVAADARRSKWQSWLESVNGRAVRLPDMTKTDLLAAAASRRASGEANLRLAALWEAIAARMDDGQRLGDVLSDADLDALSGGIAIDINVTAAMIGAGDDRDQ